MPSRRRRIQSVLDETSRGVATLGLVERRELHLVLTRAEAELSAGLNELLKEVPDKSETFTARRLRQSRAKIRRALHTMKRMRAEVGKALTSVRKRAREASLENVSRQWTDLNSIFEGEYVSLNISVGASLSNKNNLLIAKHSKLTKGYSDAIQEHIGRQLAVSTIKGESFHAMTNRLMRLTSGLSRGIKDESVNIAGAMARGLMQSPRSSMARLVRTESINAYNTYHMEALRDIEEEDPTIRKVWDATLDRRNRTCNICPNLDGQVREVDKPFEWGGIEYDQPTAHPYCRCTVVPWHEEWTHSSMQSKGTETIDAPDPKPITKRRGERAPAK